MRSLTGLAALCLTACTGGVGQPFVELEGVADDGGMEAATAEGDLDAAPAMMKDAGRPPMPKDSGTNTPKLTRACEHLESTWSASADRDASELITMLNALRTNRATRCGDRRNPNIPLVENRALECAARLRLYGQPLQRMGNSPSLGLVDGEDPRDLQDLIARLTTAEFAAGQPVAEVVVWNANNVETVLDEILEDHEITCDYVTHPYAKLIGVAKVEHVWVIDLAYSSTLPGRGSHAP